MLAFIFQPREETFETCRMEARNVIESKGTVISEKGQFGGIRLENPFTLKVGQIFTGFGVGCGVGIGVGRPINMGAIPVMNEVMSATRGATDAFSGITRHLNNSVRKLGVKNVQAGIGCGVGFGHGFGVGLAIKPSFLQQAQSSVMQAMEKVMTKLGNNPSLPISQGAVQSTSSITSASTNEHPIASIRKFAKDVPETAPENLSGYGGVSEGSTLQNALSSRSYGTRTEKVIDSFLQNPIFKGGDTELQDEVGRLRLENHLFQMVMMHQKLIQELREENNKLHQILVEDLNVSPSKLQASNIGRKIPPCSDCFECRRKQRRRRS